MKYLVIYFSLFVSCSAAPKASSNNKCLLPWKNLFESYLLFNPGSESVAFDSINSNCYNDTLSGIMELSNNIFYGNKSKNTIDYRPTYLCYSTSPTNIDSLKGDNNASDRPKGALSLPVEMIKIYFIHSLYRGDIEFKGRVLLGYKDNDVTISPNGLRTNSLIIKEAELSLEKWIELVKERGLSYVRAKNIDPLSYSNLEWK